MTTEHKVLIVDSSYRPIGISSWQDAICAVIANRFQVLEFSEDYVNSAHAKWYLPEIIVSPKNSRFKKNVRFDYDSILSRDNYTCAYCGRKMKYDRLSVDHIVPRKTGGKDSWLNCITACKRCNTLKADKSLEESKMQLLFQPIEPKNTLEAFLFTVKMKDSWKDFLPKNVVTYIEMLENRTKIAKNS